MIDFNTADTQSEGTGSAIPEDSIVPFKMTIRAPKAGKQGDNHSHACKSAKGNEYIDVEFEAQGTYSGRKVWTNFTLWGSEAARKISMRTLRAVVESARNISPSDPSPAATQGRCIADLLDMNGMVFLAKVKCVVEQSQRDGQWYVNNEFKRIITPDDAEYANGEFISDNPLPTVPAPGEKPAGASSPPAAASTWGAPPTGAPAPTPPAPPTPPASSAGPVPSWAAR